MLADIACRRDDLGFADVVILNINNLEQIPNIGVFVDHLAYAAHEMYDRLRHPISRCCFPAKDGNPRSELLAIFRTHGFNTQVSMDYAKNIQLLALVLVYALNLNIEEGLRVDSHSGCIQDVLG